MCIYNTRVYALRRTAVTSKAAQLPPVNGSHGAVRTYNIRARGPKSCVCTAPGPGILPQRQVVVSVTPYPLQQQYTRRRSLYICAQRISPVFGLLIDTIIMHRRTYIHSPRNCNCQKSSTGRHGFCFL